MIEEMESSETEEETSRRIHEMIVAGRTERWLKFSGHLLSVNILKESPHIWRSTNCRLIESLSYLIEMELNEFLKCS